MKPKPDPYVTATVARVQTFREMCTSKLVSLAITSKDIPFDNSTSQTFTKSKYQDHKTNFNDTCSIKTNDQVQSPAAQPRILHYLRHHQRQYSQNDKVRSKRVKTNIF